MRNDKITMRADLRRTWKQVKMASYKLLFQYFPGETEKTREYPKRKPGYGLP
jgi:hypothetical protein